MESMTTDSTPVTIALTKLNIPYRLFRHAGPVYSLEQAAIERGQQPEQVVRSILFRLGRDSYAMVLMAGPSQISWPALRQHLGQSRLTTAGKEEVLTVTGYEIGAVSPFGLPGPMRVLVDNSVLAQQEISIGSGERGATVIMQLDDLMRALGKVEIGDFAASA
jgi:Cys-tRNA(Pro) deacylase